MTFSYFLVVFFLGFIAGLVFVLAGVWYVLSFFFHDPEKKTVCENAPLPQSSTFQLPPVLLSKISDESCKSKESCWAVNFVLYFLFRELRNSEPIRRWILRKLSAEFDELLLNTILGKMFSNISIQNIDVGQNFPVFNWLKTSKVELHPIFKSIKCLDLLVDIDYSGGFTFSIKAATHLKHSAFLSVQIKAVKGQARIQFTTEPYAHWSFSFLDPSIDLDVVSQMYGKSFSKVTSVIASQLKRSVRKKHTLPMYKIRYKPFFTRIQHIIASLVPETSPRAKGNLIITLIECRGLLPPLLHGNVYGHVSIGDFNWVCAYQESSLVYVILDVVCVKTAKREVNLDFQLTMINEIPVVESVNAGQGHGIMQLQVDDEILSVDGKKVTNVKQCIKNFRNSASMKVVWRIRRKFEFQNDVNETGTATTNDVITRSSSSNSNNDGANSTVMRNESNIVTEAENLLKDDSPNQSRRSSDETHLENGNTDSKRRSSFTFKAFSHTSSASSSIKENIHHVSRTNNYPSTKDPIFMESFNMNVEESNRYINITLWSSKQNQISASNNSSPTNSPAKKNKKEDDSYMYGRDRLLGVLSIPLSDVVAECCSTGMGYFVKDYYLECPDGNALIARDFYSLNNHSGFDAFMCYGKISISFMYKSLDEASKRKDSLDLSTNSMNTGIETGVEAALAMDSTKLNEEHQSHQFIRTHFRSATICDFCKKKIWLKEAYICRSCNKTCHKKCIERCLANSVCNGIAPSSTSSNQQIRLPNNSNTTTPEIITTEPNNTVQNENTGDDENETQKGCVDERNLAPSTSNSNNVRRRTLGGLIVSAVTLLPPNLNPNLASRSLPQSPSTSPAASRKASVTSSSSTNICSMTNAFEILDSGGLSVSDEDLNAAVEHLVNHPNDDDLVTVAKETGKEVFSDLSLHDRKQKLNHVLNRLQEEIDTISNERLALVREEETTTSVSRKSAINFQTVKLEERVQALSILMLHFCAGLQSVQDLEEQVQHQRSSSTVQPSNEFSD